ncbi:hypothetical protein TSUD_326310 [Trifolium subterraneum]|uniref:Uncharacterized protein n=1 Tax=Trifolium subterraneum TaxID=3900 RepID=A0A2Z6MFL5_TRISU|nr:hypothetical protein TSUD_326310 [Trifolium subterraneum]
MQQHNFKGCAPILETIIYERMTNALQPKLGKYLDPPIQIYVAKRQDTFLLEGGTCSQSPSLPKDGGFRAMENATRDLPLAEDENLKVSLTRSLA